jgi:UDP:flavonoid glycosyltransferase YjiC (YdhE family)
MPRKRQITILTIGSKGDFNPACALAQGLGKAGFQVRIATNKNFKDLVTARGIDFAPIEGDYKELLSSEVGYQLLEGEANVKLVTDELFQQNLIDAWKACQGSDAIIFFPLVTWGYHIAEKLNVPCFLASYVPVSPTGQFPLLQFANINHNHLKAPLNYFSYLLIEFLMWQGRRKIINQFRQKTLGLSALPFLGARFRSNPPKQLSPLPILYGFSSAVIPRPVDWGVHLHVTGYWFLDETDNYQPPQELANFINSGSTPIFIGFGSMTARDPNRLTNIILEGLRLTKQRAILLSGWAGLGQINLPDSVFVIDYVPFGWLFPRMKAIVHHGGSGTTAFGLRAGVPSVIVPFFADQPAWGQRLANLGVSPPPIPFKELSAEKLAAAIEMAISDEQMHKRAEDLGAKIQSEDGVNQAVDVIRHYLEN